jgi:glyoxylase-like metal-dependent hydrolase (beta-lactamase superfamily II)
MKNLILIAAIIGISHMANALDTHVEVFPAKDSNVNSFIFFDSVGSLIVDTTRSSQEAVEVAKHARSHGAPPKIIFITHGHPDHYLGMGALKKEFPDAKILVANQRVKNDIINFAKFAADNHWFDSTEPAMNPKSEKNPNGFDYENEIQILGGKTLDLPGGEKLEVTGTFLPMEASHETMLYSKELNSLFASDLVYNGVHLWLGSGVDAQAITNWRSELKRLKAKYGPMKSIIYPGHGKPVDSKIFDIDRTYMKDFLAIVKKSKTQEEAKSEMIKKYPTWENTDFLLVQSIKNHFKLLKK